MLVILIKKKLAGVVAGRTPLHIARSRNDEYASEIIKLLIEHSANPNLICNVRKFLFF